MTKKSASYSIDTSALIDGLERYYPERAFRSLWQKMDELINEGRLFISEEVWLEVKAKDAVARAWCEPRLHSLMVPTDAKEAREVRRILERHERLVMAMKGRNRADPFVIAIGRLLDAIVVTGEGSDGTANRPKIPYICRDLGLPCIGITDLILQEDWVF